MHLSTVAHIDPLVEVTNLFSYSIGRMSVDDGDE